MGISRVLHLLLNRTPLKILFTGRRFFVRAYFNHLYRKTDPYGVEAEKQTEKYERAFRLLDAFSANRALEVGCGEGRLSHYIAARADRVLAIDISERAIRRAIALHGEDPRIDYRIMDFVSEGFPEGPFDLIVCSEVLYYLQLPQLADAIRQVVEILSPGGVLLLIHIRSAKDDSVGLELKEFGAKTIHEAFIAHELFVIQNDVLTPSHRITVLRKTK